jgi:hypothetical protein
MSTLSDIFNALPGLSDLMPGVKDNQGMMSSIDNEAGMSLPATDLMSDVPVIADDKSLDSLLSEMSKENLYKVPEVEPKAPVSSLSDISTALSGMKQTANKERALGASLKTAAAAGDFFSQLLTYSTSRSNISLQAENTKQAAENAMNALDNQVLYYKNQITDKFNTLMARNTVTMAAKNLRVSAGALLEQTKDAAYDATQDIRMLESNAELKKIALRSSQKQADISKKLQKNLLNANVVSSAAKLGLMVATGGGTGESWGNLFSSFQDGGSLSQTVYGTM